MEARRQAYDTLEMREFRRHDCQIYVQRAVLLTARLPGRRRATAHNWALCIMADLSRMPRFDPAEDRGSRELSLLTVKRATGLGKHPSPNCTAKGARQTRQNIQDNAA